MMGAMMETMATGAGAEPVRAVSYVKPAAVLGVASQMLQSWKKMKDCPKPDSQRAARCGGDEGCEWPTVFVVNDGPGLVELAGTAACRINLVAGEYS